MILRDAVRDIWSLEDLATIYAAAPWTNESMALVAREPPTGGLPAEAAQLGLTYFLEVLVAREFLEAWSDNLGAKPGIEQACTRLIQYALSDA